MRGLLFAGLLALGLLAIFPPSYAQASHRGRGAVCDVATGKCHEEAPAAACATQAAGGQRARRWTPLRNAWQGVKKAGPNIRRGCRGC
jgi:hypothetical protein